MNDSLDSYHGSHLSDDSATSLTAPAILEKRIAQDIFSLGIDCDEFGAEGLQCRVSTFHIDSMDPAVGYTPYPLDESSMTSRRVFLGTGTSGFPVRLGGCT